VRPCLLIQVAAPRGFRCPEAARLAPRLEGAGPGVNAADYDRGKG
jgi:hypothetical protein